MAHFRHRHRTWRTTAVIRDPLLPLYYVLDDIRTSDDEHEAICVMADCMPSRDEYEHHLTVLKENQRLV